MTLAFFLFELQRWTTLSPVLRENSLTSAKQDGGPHVTEVRERNLHPPAEYLALFSSLVAS